MHLDAHLVETERFSGDVVGSLNSLEKILPLCTSRSDLFRRRHRTKAVLAAFGLHVASVTGCMMIDCSLVGDMISVCYAALKHMKTNRSCGFVTVVLGRSERREREKKGERLDFILCRT